MHTHLFTMLNFLWFVYSPVHENRRKYNLRKPKNAAKALHPLVHTKAENIAGYEKFTLDEVIYPGSDKKEEVNNRRGNEGKIFFTKQRFNLHIVQDVYYKADWCLSKIDIFSVIQLSCSKDSVCIWFWPYLSIFQVKERSDNEEDIVLVDTKVAKEEKKEEKVEKDSEVKKEGNLYVTIVEI